METVPSLGYPLSTKGALRPAQQGSSLGQDYLILLEYVEVKEKKDPLIQRNGGGGEKEMWIQAVIVVFHYPIFPY